MKVCIQCGNKCGENDAFCEKCGHNLVQSITSNGTSSKNDIFQSKDNGPTSSMHKNRKRNTQLVSLTVFILLVGLGVKLSLGTDNGKFNPDKVNAVEFANWLIENGVCDSIGPDEKTLYGNLKLQFDSKLFRDCRPSPGNYEKRQNLNPDNPEAIKELSGYAGSITIYVGDANKWYKEEVLSNSGKKYPNDIYGRNWTLTFSSNEVAYPRNFDDLKSSMKVIANKFNAEISTNYHPGDYCSSIAQSYKYDKILGKLTSPDATKYDLAIISDCKIYFPEGLLLKDSWNTQ